ncbi:hypothetical protein CK507_15785 [Pseudomonas sp. WN033]|nr:hypothetical protein CK507_15785 [Pseudomonas sp. WN033]
MSAEEVYVSPPITFASPELLNESELRPALERANQQMFTMWSELNGYRSYLGPKLHMMVQAHIAGNTEQVNQVLDELAANFHKNVKQAQETQGVH